MTHEDRIRQHLAHSGPARLTDIATATGTGLGYARNIVYALLRHGAVEPAGSANDGTRARLYRLVP